MKSEKNTTALLEDNEISQEEFDLVRKLVYEQAGIYLTDNKYHLVKARIAKRIRVEKLKGFKEYFERLTSDKTGKEISNLIDAISTNTTYFFREIQHFDFLQNSVKELIKSKAGKPYTIRIWSAACSCGQEPYTIAMVMDDLIKSGYYTNISLKILATDIAMSVLEKAKEGIYKVEELENIPKQYHHYIKKINDEQFKVTDDLKKYITFAKFNLVRAEYQFKYGFDYVFCRNVMIYFDTPTQELVVNKITKHIRPEGYFIIGLSENLTNIKHSLKYIRPSIYQKPRL